MPGPPITVEEVRGRAARRRFLELGHLLFREEPRWAAPLAAWDRQRLDHLRNPFFAEGEAALFLLRRMGKPAGRITAHVAHPDDEAGAFGFFDVVDDPACTQALIERAAGWLQERGCRSALGPLSFTEAEERGVLVAGYDAPGATGRWWHPPWYAEGLRAAGLVEVPGSRRGTWRLAAVEAGPAAPAPDEAAVAPALIGPYVDRRLLLPGIAAVPDLAVAASEGPWQLAKRAKRGAWETCVVVRCDGDPAALVPLLRSAAAAAGYTHVIAPWTDEVGAAPETEHALFSIDL